MDTLSIIDVILILFGCANAALGATLYVLVLSADAGTLVSNKVKTSNDTTDEYLEMGDSVSTKLLEKRFGGRQWVV